MPDADAESVARELYALPPSQFTAARNARAKELQGDGQAALSKTVRAFIRPAASAWVVNRVASTGGKLKSEFETLGAKLRAAQAQADSGSLTALLHDRKALVARALRTARETATTQSVALSASALEEVSQTLQAALADPDGFSAAFSGRLVRPIRSDGLEPIDLDGAVAGPPLARSVPRPASGDGGSVKPAHAAGAARAKVDRRAAAVRKAEDALHDVDAKLAELAADQGRLSSDAAALQAQFDELQARQEDLDRRGTKLERERSAAVVASRRVHSASGG